MIYADITNQIDSIKSKLESAGNIDLQAYNPKDKFLPGNHAPSEFFSIVSLFNAQRKASLIEDFVIQNDGGKRISSKVDRGDYINGNGKYIEVKTSTTNKSMSLNIRQIRLWQEVDHYLCLFIHEQELELSRAYFLTKEEMSQEVLLCGSVMHGTKEATANNLNKEYGIMFPIYSETHPITKRWNDNYYSNYYYELLFTERK